MAAPVLAEEQRLQLVEWLAAGFSEPLIRLLFETRGWKKITHQAISYHREQHRQLIEARRREREAAAYDVGLAQREARVKALVDHALKLEEIKWSPDEKGKLWNEKAWRETLDDIAREMGQRKAGVEVSGPDGGAIEFRDVADARQELGAELARTLAALGTGAVAPAVEPEGDAESAL